MHAARSVNALFVAAIVLAIGALPSASSAAQSAACDVAGWNMTAERQLFSGKPIALVASGAATSAPRIEAGKLYVLKLVPQTSVQFAANPGKTSDAPDAHAGLVQFSVAKPGDYRVTIDGGFWIDVVAGTDLIKSNTFKGRPDCKLYHKSVEFTLSESKMLILQLSGAEPDTVRVAITPSVKPS